MIDKIRQNYVESFKKYISIIGERKIYSIIYSRFILFTNFVDIIISVVKCSREIVLFLFTKLYM